MNEQPKKRSALFWVVAATVIAVIITAAGITVAIMRSPTGSDPLIDQLDQPEK